jgi:asparagine synthase (glutamine-hydrolysing)
MKMSETLHHRGPDDHGYYFNNTATIALGHRRLSFLDLSEMGKQPMSDNNQCIRLILNGEIYNFRELKKRLENDYNFKTQTDTEVLIAAYIKWGIDCVSYLKGMFAFALFDESEHKLYLVRDRFGIKPLYYSLSDSNLLFASELKALMASGLIPKQIDYSSFADYFVYRYVPSPKTIWKNVEKLPPAHYAEINTETLDIQLTEYWKLLSSDDKADELKLIEETGAILQESVMQHIRADVPIGSFLSGGYDSSAMVYYMTALGQKPDTFSIGFNEWENSEHKFARVVADHLGVNNDCLIADKSSLDLVKLMPEVYDEPIADISIIPTYMVSQLARKKVKAVLSGEGADEIFGGYWWQQEFFSNRSSATFFEKIKNVLQPDNTVLFYANAMAMGGFDSHELKQLLHPDLHSYISKDVNWFYKQHYNKNLSPLKSIQYMDIKCFMGELVLTKIDRASMANSLEVRVPFLDHHLFEKIFSVDEKQYVKANQTKYLLYENLKNHLPKEILSRKKQGFVGPDLYYMDIEWYKRELENSKLVEHNIINRSYLDALLKESYNWKLWKILIMEKWFERWICE